MSLPAPPTVNGEVAAGFEPVRDAFVNSFAEGREVGAAVSVYHLGRCVVDLWGGLADPTTGLPWARETKQVVFSVTKAAVSVCAHLLVERGELDLDAPVSTYWPEFAAAGKARLPVRWLLTHQAGLVALDEPLPRADALRWEPMVRALAAQRPNWEPGTAHGIHIRTYGWLVGEVIRRLTGRTPGVFFADEVAGPLGLEFFIGLPAGELPHTGQIIEADEPTGTRPYSLPERARRVTTPDLDFNDPAVLTAEIPASNGVCTARSLARLFAALVDEVDGRRVLRPETLAAARIQQVAGMDRVMSRTTRFSTGFMLYPAAGAASHTFGYTGRGGSMGFGNVDSGVAFGYVTNYVVPSVGATRRATDLAKVVRACVAARTS